MKGLLLAALVLPDVPPQDSELTPKQRRALVHIGHLAISAHLFREFNGDFPRGLRDLIVRPRDSAQWPEGGFLGVDTIPKDPWGNDYEYDPRGDKPRIWSWGADGAPGGEGENGDLSEKDLFQSVAGLAKVAATRAILKEISVALESFKLDNNLYPDDLVDLDIQPRYVDRWLGPYLRREARDGWGRKILYRIPGTQGRPYDLVSLGADGREGGEGPNADITLAPQPPKPEVRKDEPPFQFDPWQAWASFGKGSWVEQESTSQFGEMPEAKSLMRTTVTDKTEREVKGTRTMGGLEMADQLLADKGWKSGGPGGDGSCPMCGKAHKKSDQKWSREEIDVAGRRLRCDVLDQTSYDCKGERQYVSKLWYSKEVPGWMARSEFEMFGSMRGTTKSVTIGYEKK